MDIDADLAAALGWPKAKYAWVERERRWLCDHMPVEPVVGAEHFTDLYITGTCLRLRSAVPMGGGATMRRLGRKADVTPSTRLLTSIYLSENEYALLATLPGKLLRKTRYSVATAQGAVSVDRFEGGLDGLVLAEVEFDSEAAMQAYAAPSFCRREVTDDVRYTGGILVERGLPEPLAVVEVSAGG